MRPVSLTVNGIGTSAPIVLNYMQTPFNASISVIVTGVATYTVQHTFDDIFASNYVAANGNWWNNDNANLVGATSSQTGNYSAPIRASRLVVNNAQPDASVTLEIIQGLGHGSI